jgi:hypothetical protein
MFVFAGRNICGGAGSFVSSLVLPSLSACNRASNWLATVRCVGRLFLVIYCFYYGTFMVLGPVLHLPLPPTSCRDRQYSFSALSVLFSASKEFSVWMGALFMVFAWDVWIE